VYFDNFIKDYILAQTFNTMPQSAAFTDTEIKFILYVLAGMIGLLIGIFAFLGKFIVGYLKSIAISMGRMEKDLSILTNDHTNLKDDHRELKGRVSTLEQKVK
jgi:hypothetical protein